MTDSRFALRRDKLRRLIGKQGVQGILITNFHNVTYLTGFTGDDSYLLLTADHTVMLSDTRYDEQLEGECPDVECEIRTSGVTMLSSLQKVVKQAKLTTLAFEAASMTVATHQAYVKEIPQLTWKETSGLVESLREIKDADEIQAIERAVFLAENTFAVIRAGLRGEQTEREIASNIEHQIRQFGGRGCSFAPIVAVGARAALPHATPTAQPISAGEFVLIDWGACEGLYRSDLTRVLVTGTISPKLKRIYGVVLTAQQRAIAAVKPGARMSDVDAVARNYIAKAGYGKQFGHGLGHGIGLEIHESPRLASNQDRPLRAGMVITIEPGIYVPGWGGVRIEDDILVTRSGHRVLTSQPKEFEECIVRNW